MRIEKNVFLTIAMILLLLLFGFSQRFFANEFSTKKYTMLKTEPIQFKPKQNTSRG